MEISEITGVSRSTIKLITRQPFVVIYDKIISGIQPKRATISVDNCHSFYQKIFDKIGKSTKYRNPLKLAPIAIFFYLKSKECFFCTTEFIFAADLTREEFRKGFKTIFPLCKKPTHNHNKAFIHSLINQIQEDFELDSSFGKIARIFLNRFGPLLMNTKPEITAGVVCILSLLRLNIRSITSFTICRTLGFQMSAALYQVKNNILKRWGIKGFKGFRKTPQLIEPLLQDIPAQAFL